MNGRVHDKVTAHRHTWKRWIGMIVAVAMLAGIAVPLGRTPAAQAAPDGSNVVISQIYGGGGNSGAEYKHDFVELYNPTDSDVSLDGWEVRYGSATGSMPTSGANVTALSGTIKAHGYFLIRQSAGAGGTLDLPEPDAAGSATMSGSDGKVGLFDGSGAGAAAIDLVGFGSASMFEGAAATGRLSSTTAAIRKAAPGDPDGRGLDTDDNASDFAVSAPDPRNSAYSAAPGGPVVRAAPDGSAPVPAGTEVALSASEPGATVWAAVYGSGGSELYEPYDEIRPIVIDEDTTVKAYASAAGVDGPVAEFRYAVVGRTDVAAARSAAAGATVWTEGVVTHIAGAELYFQDDTAGLVVYSYPGAVEVGDRIEVQGKRTDYRGLQELDGSGATVRIVQKNAGLPAPQLVTAADLSAGSGELHEAELVYMEHIDIVGRNGSEVTARQGSDTFIIYSGLSKLAPGARFEQITGVVKQFDAIYELIPLNENALVEQRLSVTASPGAGAILKGNAVALATPMEGGAIYYTTDGSTPTAASALYTAPIPIERDMTIKAIVVAGGETSGVFAFAYEVRDGAYRIRDIQGAGHRSPFAGQPVTGLEGVVTQYANGSGYAGFFMQDPEPDNDDRTSEGILVYSTDEASKPAIGDLVAVTGEVTEYNEGSADYLTTTEIMMDAIAVLERDHALPGPVVLGAAGRTMPSAVIDNDGLALFDPEEDAIDFFESLEGMRVLLPEPTIISPYWTSRGGVLNIPTRIDNDGTEVATPAGGVALKEAGNLNPQRVIIAAKEVAGEVGTGDRFADDVAGVIRYDSGAFKLIPESLPAIERSEWRRETTTIGFDADKLTIASYNVENYHQGVGRDKTDALAQAIVANLQTPDIIGLVEVQDNNGATDDGTVEADENYEALVQAIRAAGGPAYAYTDIAPEDKRDGGEPGGNIRVGFLYNPARVTLSASEFGRGTATAAVAYDGAADRLSHNPGRIDPTNAAFVSSRKPLAAQFEFRGEKVIVIANHFNSKSGDGAPFGSAQPPVLASEAQRHQIAQVVNGFVKDVLAQNAGANIALLGDLNDFQFTETLSIVKGDELVNLIDALPPGERYTYTYDGNSQVLDHLLVSKRLAHGAQVDIVHLNADFPPSRGRVSDHDPVLAQLDLKSFPMTILHTNDTHANLDSVSSPNNIARRVTAIREARAASANPLLVDAGDVFSGTLYFNQYLGQADLAFMNLVGYDAMTFGNHEFDKNSEVLDAFIGQAAFPFVSSNVNFMRDERLNRRFVSEIGAPAANATIYPALIKDIGGERVGLIGLTTEDTANIASPGDVTFDDAVASANGATALLKEQGVNKIVALSHLGFEEDVKLARAVEGIDVIVGGHTHTKLDEAVVDNSHGAPTLIVQAGEKGQFLGKLRVVFDEAGVLTAWDEELIAIDAMSDGEHYDLAEDPEAKRMLDELYKPGVEELSRTVVGQTDIALNGERADVREKETNLGNLIADGMLDAARAAGTDAVIALQNGGGIRASIDEGPITQGEVMTVLPFNNDLVTVRLTGEEIRQALENGVSRVGFQDGRFPHVAGLRFYYDSTKPANERVMRIDVTRGDGYAPLDPEATYEVATNAFTARGGDFYDSLAKAYEEGRVTLLMLPDYEVFTNYIRKLGTITADNAGVEGRIVDLKGAPLPEDELTAERVAAGITAIEPPMRNARRLTLPAVPDGFSLAIQSSDKPNVIAADGGIRPPARATDVTLVLEVTRISDMTTASTAPLTVAVPARSQSGGGGGSGGAGDGSGGNDGSAGGEPSVEPDGPGTLNVTARVTGEDGRRVAAAVLTAEALSTALENADGGITLRVTAAEAFETAELTLDSGALAALKGRSTVTAVTVATPFGEYELPISELDLPALAAQLGAGEDELAIVIAIGRDAEAEERAAAGGLQPLAAVRFAIAAMTDDGRAAEIDTFGRYVRRTIRIGASAAQVAVVRVNGAAYDPVPFRANGAELVVFSRTNSTYMALANRTTFADLSGHWSRAEVESLAGRMIVTGRSGSAFDPNASVTRAEFAALIVRSLGLAADGTAANFTDVEAGGWYAGAVKAAVDAGLVNGYADGTFRPGQTITRQEMAAMAYRALHFAGYDPRGATAAAFADEAAIAPWAATAANSLGGLGILEGDELGRFLPLADATRAESAAMLNRLLSRLTFER